MVDPKKKSLVDPEKIHYRSRKNCIVDPEKNPWPIVASSIQIQLGTMQSLTLPYLPPSLSLHPGKQNGSLDLTPTPACFCCVPIIYHMSPPFVYEGPAVAVLSSSRRSSVDIVYIDFKRAFDSISHRKLIHKLAGYGIHGNLLLWITVFLDSRSQSVRVGSALSLPSLVISGVPQGSCIGCALFILFINDVTDCITPSTFAKLFADDLKLYSEVSCPVYSNNIQHNLDLIFIWSNTWQLPISTPKCNTLHVGTSPANSYTISNHYLCNVSPVKDLVILVDSRLKFVDHIQDIVCRASNVLILSSVASFPAIPLI